MATASEAGAQWKASASAAATHTSDQPSPRHSVQFPHEQEADGDGDPLAPDEPLVEPRARQQHGHARRDECSEQEAGGRRKAAGRNGERCAALAAPPGRNPTR